MQIYAWRECKYFVDYGDEEDNCIVKIDTQDDMWGKNWKS